MTTTSYLTALNSNLRHLRLLIPPQPKRNLAASTAPTVPVTESDPFLQPNIRWRNIPVGRPGTKITLQTMVALAREAVHQPEFRQFAAQFSSLEDLESWTRERFVYRDENEEVVRTPMFMLRDMGRTSQNRIIALEGDCDDISTFLAAAAKVLGYPARFVAIRYHSDSPDFEHVFAQALRGREWVTLDPTVDTGTVICSIENMTEVV